MSIRVKPRRAKTFNAERSHTRQTRHSKHPNKHPNKHLANITPFMTLSAIAILAGCYRPATNTPAHEANNNTAVAHPSEDPTLPSMTAYTTTYTLERTRGKQAGGPPSSAQNAGEPLSPGEYCFHKENADYWLSIRLALSDDNNKQLNGESAGTIIHPEQGTTYYKQSFSGTLTNNQALVQVTTTIDGFTQKRQEAWAIDSSSLDMGRVSIANTPCLEISSNFQ